MSMSTYVLGFHEPNKKWKEMKKIYDACSEAGVDIPKDVNNFFGYEEPDDLGVVVYIEDTDCCSKYADECSNGFQIDIRKLPENITHIRFFNSF